MKNRQAVRFVWLVGLLAATLALAADVVVLRPNHRTAADLQPALAAALGAEGTVAVDARTGSLIVQGSDAAIARARRVLAELDVAPRTILLEVQAVGRNEYENLGVHVDWTVAGGNWQVGRLPADRGTGVTATGAARIQRSSDASKMRLRVLEGSTATLAAGTRQTYRPGAYGWSGWSGPAVTGEIEEVQSALVVTPRVVGDVIELEIAPQATFHGDRGDSRRRFADLATTVRVRDGEQILLGGLADNRTDRLTDFLGGLSVTGGRRNAVLLVRATIEKE